MMDVSIVVALVFLVKWWMTYPRVRGQKIDNKMSQRKIGMSEIVSMVLTP